MGKSKHSKWFDENYGDDARGKKSRMNEWEARRQQRRIAWEQKSSFVPGNDEDLQEYD